MPREDLIQADRLAETLVSLIAAASVNPFGGPPTHHSEGEGRALAYVARRLEALGWHIENVDAAPNRPSLIASAPFEMPSTASRAVVLAGHLDTVGVAGYENPFVGQLEGRRIKGRGACDMKAALACYLEVAEVLASTRGRNEVGGKLLIAAVADEEFEQKGAKSVRNILPPTDLVVIGEPTHLHVCTASKGLAAFTLTVKGRATHGSVPGAGSNAIERAAEIIEALKAHAGELKAEKHPLLGHAVLNVGVIRGGSRANIVPASCEIDISRRLLPGETPAGARLRIEDALQKRIGAQGWCLSDAWWCVDAYENEDAAIVDAFRRSASRAGIVDLAITGFPASSDAPYFGAPVVICGPGSLDQAHSLDEWVDLDEMVAATRVYLQFVEDHFEARAA